MTDFRLLKVLAAGMLALPLGAPAFAADTVDELARAAEFTFAICSDNHGVSPFSISRQGYSYEVHMDRLDQWIKDTGDKFIVGVGDHTYHYYRNDPMIPFMNTDSFWHANFYPNLGNHDNKCYSNHEGQWCGGSPMYDETDIRSRSCVTFRPNGCEYHARIPVNGWTVHVIAVHYAYYNANPLISFTQDSRDYLIGELNAISRGPKDIVIATAHRGDDGGGNWVGFLSAAEQQVVMEKCDLVIAADTHAYQRRIHANYGATAGALCLNDGRITGQDTNGDGYIECFMFDNPPRVVTNYHDIANHVTPQLRTDTLNGAYCAYIKKVGQVANSVDWIDSTNDWDAFPAVAASLSGTLNGGWNLFSIPLDPASPSAPAVLSGLITGGNKLSNNLMRYDPAGGYQLYPRDFTTIEAGRAYWLRLDASGTTSFAGTSRPDVTALTLAQGWSLVGAPRTWPVSISGLQVKKGTDSPAYWSTAVANGWVGDTLYYYDGSAYKTAKQSGGNDSFLRPWRGYWLKANLADLSLLVPNGAEPAPPVRITDVQVSNVTQTSATVSWNTAVFSTSRIDYGLSAPNYTNTTGTDSNLTRTHSMTLAGLTANTTYHYRIVSTRDYYASGVTPDAAFTTVP